MTESGVVSDLLLSRLSNILASQAGAEHLQTDRRPLLPLTSSRAWGTREPFAVIDEEREAQAGKGASSQRHRPPGHRSSDDFCGSQVSLLEKAWESHVGVPAPVQKSQKNLQTGKMEVWPLGELWAWQLMAQRFS